MVSRGKENGKGKQENISFAEERKSEKEQVEKFFCFWRRGRSKKENKENVSEKETLL